MPVVGKYCKAYLVESLVRFPGWENTVTYQKDVSSPDSEESERRDLQVTDVLYLQEDFTVTDGIMKDENVVLSSDEISQEWIAFCKTELEFEPPAFE